MGSFNGWVDNARGIGGAAIRAAVPVIGLTAGGRGGRPMPAEEGQVRGSDS